MRNFLYTIKRPDGIHAVPAAELAREAKKYNSFITIARGASETDMTNILKLLSMSVKKGETVLVMIEGEDEEIAAQNLENYFRQHL